MPRMPYVRFFPTDFLEGTRSMPPESVGDYIRLLCTIYDRGGKVPNDPYMLRHVLRMPRAIDAIKAVERLIWFGKLSIDADNFLHNQRADLEIQKYESQLPKESKEQKKGAAKGAAKGVTGTPEKAMNSTRARTQTRSKNTNTDKLVPSSHARKNGNGTAAASVGSPGLEGRSPSLPFEAKATGPPRSEIEARLTRQLAERGLEFAPIVASLSLETYNAAVDAEMTEAGAGLALILGKAT